MASLFYSGRFRGNGVASHITMSDSNARTAALGDLTPARTLPHRFYSSMALPLSDATTIESQLSAFHLAAMLMNPTNAFPMCIGKRCVGSMSVLAKQKLLNWASTITNMVDVAIG